LVRTDAERIGIVEEKSLTSSTASAANGIELSKGSRQSTGLLADAEHYDLTDFSLADMVHVGRALRRLVADAGSFEDAAQKVVRYLYDDLRGATERSCILVRFFTLLPYRSLPSELRECAAAKETLGALVEDTNCLTLLATVGDDPGWNSRHESQSHKCIPLVSESMIERFPMISQLIRQFGLSSSEFLRATPEIIKDVEQKNFGVFHVPQAAGSPFVPAQKDFVLPHGVASVLGLGGRLANGSLFAVILFTRVPVAEATAEMFRTVALNLKLGILDVSERSVFVE
jgi:two-component system NtrC family sensor kinase